jgi:uncharacterized membrane protein
MARTIGNPLSWAMDSLGGMFGYASSAVDAVAGHHVAPPQTRHLTTQDLRAALAKGWADVQAFRSDVIFVCLLYPIIGGLLVALAVSGAYIQLLFPILTGFALTGPVAAIGLFEMSRRREKGMPTSWLALFDVIRSPKFGGILVLSLFHLVVFMVWIMLANLLFNMTLGPEVPDSITALMREVVTTPAGWLLAIVGTFAGFCLAVAVLAISVVSFPLLLDRDVSLAVAVTTSVQVARENPVVIATWGLIVAGTLALGAIPALLGLVLVLPLLGHATWHLYRAAVV